jgi:hypothetical protein
MKIEMQFSKNTSAIEKERFDKLKIDFEQGLLS